MQAPALLHSEPDLLIKIVRDVFNEDFQKMIIEGDDARQDDRALPRAVAPDLLERVEAYDGERDAFDEFRISEQIEKALDRKVWLPSGGSLVIDRTEAMTVVDVNTGKFVGSGGNLEETVTKNNLEAAEEIVRQLRLRDIGGIIVVDFIDMVLESNRDLVLRRLVECLSPRPHEAPGRRGHLARPRADDPQEARPRAPRVVQRALRGLRRPRHHRAPRTDREAPRAAAAGRASPRAWRRQRRRAPSAAPASRQGAAGTHAITDDVKHALAQIAASTVAHGEHKAVRPGRCGGSPCDPGARSGLRPARVRVAADVAAGVARPAGRRARAVEPRDAGRGSRPRPRPSAEAAPEREAVAAVAPRARPSRRRPSVAPIIELPRPPRRPRAPRRVAEAETLLDSVLDALPAPKAAGEGRRVRAAVACRPRR